MTHFNDTAIETKDGDSVSAAELKEAVDGFMTALEAEREANDERLSAIEKNGVADPTTLSKMEKIAEDIEKFDSLNQKLVKKNAERENENKELREMIDELKAAMQRPEGGGNNAPEDVEKKAFHTFIVEENPTADEIKALSIIQSGDDEFGGVYAPNAYIREIIKDIVESSYGNVRSVARVMQTTSRATELPARSSTFKAKWVKAEQDERPTSEGYTTKLLKIPTHEMIAEVKITNQELEDSVFDIETEMRKEFVEQFARLEGEAYINGDGNEEIEGMLSNESIGSINSGVADGISGDGLIKMIHEGVKSPYTAASHMLLNRKTIGAIRMLKDDAGQYVMQDKMLLTSDLVSTFLGIPFLEVPDMPDIAANTFPILFGDFRTAYRIFDRLRMSIMRDPYTDRNRRRVIFTASRRLGAQVVQPEAIVKLKIAA